MAGFRQIAGEGYGSAYVDALIAGGMVWHTTVDNPLTFGFGHQFGMSTWLSMHGNPKLNDRGDPILPQGGQDDMWDANSWDPNHMTPIVLGLAQVEAVTQLSFDLDLEYATNHFSDANIVLFGTDLDNWAGGAVWAVAETPQERFELGSTKSWLYLNTRDDGAWDLPHPGGMGFSMILNMLGSALGLAQAYHGSPGVASPYDLGPLGHNQAPFTVMSANWSHAGSAQSPGDWGSMKTFGAFDIAALQAIYGTNTTTAAGNDVYELPTHNGWNGMWGVGRATGWTCIWDTGGVDTITGKDAKLDLKIDLRAATLATGDPNAGGYISQAFDLAGSTVVPVAGGFTIAKGVVIENAIGGLGNDTLIGNSAANRLEGGAGNDTYYIQNANDVVVDTSGNDTVYATFNYSNSSIENIYVNGVKVVSGGVVTGSGFRPIKGTSGKNNLVGKETNDKLYGGLGNDKLTGKGGLDIFVFNTKPNKNTNKDTITDFKVADDTIWLDNKIFKKLGSKGSEKSPAMLKASFFKISDKAKDRDDYLVYNKKTGVLSYDGDGSGKGQAVEFALLKKNLALKYDDFGII